MKDFGSRRTSERVRRLVNHDFMQLHNEGYSIPEIARITSLSSVTVYNHLQAIADKYGTTRDELLKVHRKESVKAIERATARVKADAEKMMETYETAINATNELIELIDECINDENV